MVLTLHEDARFKHNRCLDLLLNSGNCPSNPWAIAHAPFLEPKMYTVFNKILYNFKKFYKNS